MNPELIIHESKLASVQDIGRYGYENYGFSNSGALDQFAYQIGNALLGNDLREAAIEITALKFSMSSNVDLTICVTGAPAQVKVNENIFPQWETITIKAGETLSISNIQKGMRVYICVANGLRTPLVHGSASYDSTLNIGKKLNKGNSIQLHTGKKEGLLRVKGVGLPKQDIPHYGTPWRINICHGPDYEMFRNHMFAFQEAEFLVSPNSNHIGIRLERYILTKFFPRQKLSRGVIPGAIEITSAGQPIVLLRGRGGTIGYPVIACVSSSDLCLMGQVRPGDRIQFSLISMEEAVLTFRKKMNYIKKCLNNSRMKHNIH